MAKMLGKVAGAPLGAIPFVGKKLKRQSDKLHGISKKPSGSVLAEGFAPGPPTTTSQFK